MVVELAHRQRLFVGAGAPALGYAPRRSVGGIAIVAGLHLLLLWALLSGLAQRVVEVVKAPIQTRLIDENPAPRRHRRRHCRRRLRRW